MTTSFELNGHLTTAVGLPFIASLLVARVYKRGWVRWFSALVTSVSLTLVASVAWCLGLGSHDAGWAIDQTSRLPLPSSQALLGLDVLGAQIAVIVSLLVLGTIVGAPHRVMAGGNARRILALHGATIGLVCSRDLVLIGLFWGLGALLAVACVP